MSEPGFSDRATESVNGVVAAVMNSQSAAVRRALDAVTEDLGIGPCIDEVLMAAVRRVARGPDVAPMRVGLAVETARAWLAGVTVPAPDRRPPLVLACGPGDRHSLGLEALAVLLRYRRQPCRLLGARVTASRLAAAVTVNRPRGVVLVAHRESAHRASVDELRDLHESGVTAFYAGAAFDTVLARQDVPGIYLGTSFQGACTAILRALPAEGALTSPTTA